VKVSEEVLSRLNKRLVDGDPTATAEAIETLLGPLTEELTEKNSKRVDPHMLQDAAEDALLKYVKNPTMYRPSRLGLFGYLTMAAQGDLKNELAKLERRRKNEKPLKNVEVEDRRGNEEVEDPDLGSGLEKIFDDPRDLEIARLIADKERSTVRYAAVLGLSDRPAEEQRREVKREKDRVKKRMQRDGKRIIRPES
jgi:hypothetical protein